MEMILDQKKNATTTSLFKKVKFWSVDLPNDYEYAIWKSEVR